MDIVIRKLEQVEALTGEERAALRATFGHVRHCRAGDELARPGGRAMCCGAVLKGMLAKCEILPDGSRQITALILPGDFVDLHGFAFPTSDHSMVALTPTAIATAGYDAVSGLTRSQARLGALMFREAMVEVSILRQWVVNCGRRTANGRMAHLLCELHTRLTAVGLARPDGCDMPLTQAMLSDATELSIVHVNRVLQNLRREGLISLKAGQLSIHDWAGLSEVGGFNAAYLHIGSEAPRRRNDLGIWSELNQAGASAL